MSPLDRPWEFFGVMTAALAFLAVVHWLDFRTAVAATSMRHRAWDAEKEKERHDGR